MPYGSNAGYNLSLLLILITINHHCICNFTYFINEEVWLQLLHNWIKSYMHHSSTTPDSIQSWETLKFQDIASWQHTDLRKTLTLFSLLTTDKTVTHSLLTTDKMVTHKGSCASSPGSSEGSKGQQKDPSHYCISWKQQPAVRALVKVDIIAPSCSLSLHAKLSLYLYIKDRCHE